MRTFEELGIVPPILRAITEMGYEQPMPVQEEVIPQLLGNTRDIIALAQTGTGKTAAFGLPIIQKTDTQLHAPQTLILCPTRELCLQIAGDLADYSEYVEDIKILPVYGGSSIESQIKTLKRGVHVVVATPGRLIDLINRKTVSLENVHTVVLDEADEMLNMGFIEDIETILKEVPGERQTLLFSATMPKPIQDLAQRFMKEPEFICIRAKEVTVPNTEQNYLEVPESQKFDVLCRLLDIQSPELAIVFGRTKRRVDELSEALSKRGYMAEGIHGDLTQARRDIVLKHFKEGSTEILVATDVAARGLDIKGVTHVYNFDIPQDPEGYVHRIGRTGRAGQAGLATTLVTPREIGFLRVIEQITKRKILRIPVPSVNDAVEGQQQIAIDKLMETVGDDDTSRYKELAKGLLENTDSVTLLAAALKLLTKEPATMPIKLTEESSLRFKKPRSQRFDTMLPRGKHDRGKGNFPFNKKSAKQVHKYAN